jgi:hypothetical protein
MIDKFFAKIQAEKEKMAHEAVAVKPGEGKDISFEYGYRQGVYQGLEMARQLIESVLRDQDKRDSDL